MAADVDLVGPNEVAEMLGVQRATVTKWLQRGVAPTPATTLSTVPLWRRADIEEWARETGRL